MGFAAFAFGESSLSDRVEAIELLGGAFEAAGDGAEEYLKQALKLAFAVAPRWFERACLVKLRELLAKLCAKHPLLAPALLAKGLVKQASHIPNPQAAYTFLSWSILVVPLLNGKMLTNQLLALAQFLEVIRRAAQAGGRSRKGAQRRWQSSSKAMQLLLERFAPAVDCYMGALGEAGGGLAPTAAATTLVLNFLGGAGQLDAHKELLAKQYEAILIAKARPRPEEYTCFDSFLASLTADEFEALIVPVLPRAMKRGPEVVVLPLTRMVGVLTCGAALESFATATIVPFAIDYAKDAYENRGPEAIALVEALARSATEATTVYAWFELMEAAHKASAESLSEQRVLMLRMMTALAKLSPMDLSPVAAGAVAALVPLMKNERTLPIKDEYTAPLGEWLYFMEEIPSNFVKFSTNVLGNAKSEAVRRGLLMAVLRAFDSDALVQQGHVFVAPILQIFLACADKPGVASVRAREGVAAARVLTTLATADSAASEALGKSPFWGLLLSPKGAKGAAGPLGFWAALEAQSGSELLVEVCSLFEVILSDHAVQLTAVENSSVVYSSFVMMLNHGDTAVRQAATAATTKLLNKTPALSRSLLPAFGVMLHSLGDKWELAGTSNGYAEYGDGTLTMKVPAVAPAPAPAVEGEKETTVVNAGVLTDALVHASQHLSVKDAADYLLIAHHPALLAAKDGLAWQRFTARSLKRVANEPLFRAQIPAFCECLLGERGLGSLLATDRQAASHAICSLSRWDFHSFSAAFIPRLQASVDYEQAANLTQYDINIFESPDNEICNPELKNIYEGLTESVESTNFKKAAGDRGRTALYSADDLAWEEELRKELEAKKAKEGAPACAKGGRGKNGRGHDGGRGRGDKQQPKQMSAKEMMEEKARVCLATEQARRAELFSLSDSIIERLSALSAMIATDSESAQAMLHGVILPFLMPFVAAALAPVSRCAVEVLEVIVKATATTGANSALIGSLAPAIVHAIALLKCAPNMRKEYSASGGLASCVAMLVRSWGGPRG